MNRQTLKSFAVAGLALFALLAPSTVSLDDHAQPEIFKNISAVTLKAFDAAKGKPVDSVLIIDSAAKHSSAVLAISGKLKSLGGSLYSGSLTSAEARSLLGVTGVSLDVNHPANTGPLPTPTKPDGMSDLLWDAAVTIPGTDPALAAARTSAGVDGTGVMVAVLDTGVDSNALGLGNGKVVHREDFTTPPSNGSCTDKGYLDPFGHGTHVASIIAGASDSRDSAVQGVAPGAQIVDLRVFNCTASGDMADVDSALQWILDHKQTYPIKVVNMSLGASGMQTDGLDPTSILVNRLVASGVVVAIAAGNNGDGVSTLTAPGTAEFATTVAAATVNKYGAFLAPFSSIGPTSDGRPGIDITAPGGGIRAALTTAKGSGYEQVMSGTSMATPYIAGVAALLVQQNPGALPSGTVCDVSVSCPAGVVKASMTNGIQSLMKTSDWFEVGVDAKSGAGLVSASSSLTGTSVAPAAYQHLTTDPDSDNTLTFGAHAKGFSFNIILDSPYRTDMWDKVGMFNVTTVNANYDSSNPTQVCTLLASTTCQFGPGGWTPRSFNFYVAPSDQSQTFVIRTARQVGMGINIPGLDAPETYANGVAVNNATLVNNSASVTLTRTVASETPTTFTITPSGPLVTPSQVTLPAGAVGTQVQVSVAKSGDSQYSSERIVFSSTDGLLIASSVALATGGDGRIAFPNALGYDNSGDFQQTFIADDGSLLGFSSGAGMTNASGYGNPWRLPAGSRTIQVYTIPQTSASQIDSVGLSQNGAVGLFREFPAGAGIVPGDTSLNWTYFTRNFATGDTYEVGPDWTLWPNWYSAPYPSMQLSDDGASAVWSTTYPSGDKPVVIVKQSGAGMQTKTTLDTFPSTYTVTVQQVSHGKVLVRVRDGVSLDEFRVYTDANTYTVVPGNTFSAWDTAFSEDGSAIGLMNPNSDTMACVLNGNVTTFVTPRQLGQSNSQTIRVANDCSWIIVPWDKKAAYPRGSFGVQLLKIYANGTVSRIDQSPGTAANVEWISNFAGTQWVRVTSLALEPGDINGATDFYRGLGLTTPETVKLRQQTPVFMDMDFSALQYGVPRKLGARTVHDGALTYRVTGGLCHIEGDYVIADAASGNCSFEVWAAETDTYLAAGGGTSITMAKRTLNSSDAYFQAPTTISVGVAASFTFVNNTAYQFTLSTAGPCAIANGKVTATGAGTCQLKASRSATDTENAFEGSFSIAASANPTASVTITSSANALNYGATRTLTATNTGNGVLSFRVASGSCQITGNQLLAQSGTGTCLIVAETTATSTWLAGSASQAIQLAKVPFDSASVTLRSSASTMRFGELLAYTFTKTNLRNDITVAATGPCELVNGKISPTGIGVCRLTASAPETANSLGYSTFVDVAISKASFAASALSISAPDSAAHGASFTPVITNTTGQEQLLAVSGGCTLSNGAVTMDNSGTDCVIFSYVFESANYLSISATATVKGIVPVTNVTSQLTDLDWTADKVLPSGSMLNFNANVTVLSGACVANAGHLVALGPSGTCSVRVGGYTASHVAYSTLNLTVKLGPKTQTWTTTLPTWSTKKSTTQLFVLLTNGSPKTNAGIVGKFTVTSGAKVIVSGKNVTIDMGKLKKVVVTLTAAPGFRLPGITKTWTITR